MLCTSRRVSLRNRNAHHYPQFALAKTGELLASRRTSHLGGGERYKSNPPKNGVLCKLRQMRNCNRTGTGLASRHADIAVVFDVWRTFAAAAWQTSQDDDSDHADHDNTIRKRSTAAPSVYANDMSGPRTRKCTSVQTALRSTESSIELCKLRWGAGVAVPTSARASKSHTHTHNSVDAL